MIRMILKGVVIGIANIIPGVSGGTMAVSMGIYDKMIHAATHLFSEFKKSMKVLIPIIIGAAIGVVALARIIEIMFEKIPLQTNLLFIGLIVGGLPAVTRKVKGKSIRLGHILSFLAFFCHCGGNGGSGRAGGRGGRFELQCAECDKAVFRGRSGFGHYGNSRRQRFYDADADRLLQSGAE